MPGVVLEFPHRRPLEGGGAESDTNRSAVIPLERACLLLSKEPHHFDGMLSRVYHLRARKIGTPTSLAITSGDDQQTSTMSRKDLGVMAPTIRLAGLKSKPILSKARLAKILHNCLMDKPLSGSRVFLDAFTLRVYSARESSGLTQEEMAHLLQTSQPTYSKYEGRSLMPHRHIWAFCLACKVSIEWLMTGQGKGVPLLARPKPEKRRGRKPRKRVAA